MKKNSTKIPKLVKGIAWLSISRTLTQVYLFVVTICIANILSPADYAVMGVAMLVIGLLNLFTEFGLGQIIVQRIEITLEDTTALFWFVILIGAITSLIVILAARPAEVFFSKTGIRSVMTALAIIPLLKSLSIIPYKFIERNLRFETKAKIDLCSRFSAISIGAIAAFLGAGIWSLVSIQVSEGLILTVLAYSAEPIKIRFCFPMNNIKNMIGFGLNIIALRLAWYMRAGIAGVIGGKFLNKVDFGYYSFGFQLAQKLADVVANITSIVSVPILSRDQNDQEKLKIKYLMFTKYTALITFPVFIGGALLSKEIISVFLSDKWLPVIGIFRVACLVQILRIMNSLNENLFISIGKPNYSLRINIVSILTLTVSFLVGIRSGLNGLLIVWMVVFPLIFTGWSAYTFYYNHISCLSYFKSIKAAILASITMTLTILLFKNINLGNLNLTTIGKILNLTIPFIFSGFVYLITAHLIDKKLFSFIFNHK